LSNDYRHRGQGLWRETKAIIAWQENLPAKKRQMLEDMKPKLEKFIADYEGVNRIQ